VTIKAAVEIEAPNEELAETMRTQLKEAEEKKKVAREARRLKKKNTAEKGGWKSRRGQIE
jgi:hypothetical protein